MDLSSLITQFSPTIGSLFTIAEEVGVDVSQHKSAWQMVLDTAPQGEAALAPVLGSFTATAKDLVAGLEAAGKDVTAHKSALQAFEDAVAAI
jgi:hypothetical protein